MALITTVGKNYLVPVEITKTVAAIATPEAVAASGTFFLKATFIGKKAARTDNTGIVYIGVSATNDTQGFEITPGGELTIEAPKGNTYDLADFYIDVLNAGDGVFVMYT